VTSSRKIALAAGVLFLLTFVTSIVAAILYGPVIDNPNYITGPGADGRILFGAFLEVFLIVTNLGTALVLFPILKRQNETISLAFVAARIIESVFIAIGIVALLVVVTLRQHAAGADSSSLLVIGEALVAVNRWTFVLGPGVVVGFGNGMILGYLMYKSGLMPRGLAIFGLVGGPLIVISGLAVVLGLIERGGAIQGIATGPEFIWELSIGLYLTFKGFKSNAPVLAPERREHGATPAYAAA
jgi:Domain of unknown function (DUF4386)